MVEVTSNWSARLAGARAVAERELAAQLGSATLCRIHTDGRVTGGAKYAEGRLVALADLQRRLRGTEAGNPVAVWASELRRWADDLERLRAQDRPALPWLAYRQGGVDALEEFAPMSAAPGAA